jgi:hypothetical protein
MRPDPLRTALRLRQLALEEARRSLAICLAEESAAERDAAAAEAEIAREIAAASELSADDAPVDALAAWLPGARRRAADARARHETAQANTSVVRAALAASRAATEAAEELLAQREAQRRAQAERRTQAEMDESGRAAQAIRRVSGDFQ